MLRLVRFPFVYRMRIRPLEGGAGTTGGGRLRTCCLMLVVESSLQVGGDSWRSLLANGFLRGDLAFDGDPTSAKFCSRLCSLSETKTIAKKKRHALDKKSCPLSVKVQGLELEDPDRVSVVGAMNEGTCRRRDDTAQEHMSRR
jgi:hypothetical protein